MKQICVIGLGYVGLPTAALLAQKGYHVVGVDIDSAIVSAVNAGVSHIAEHGLEQLLADMVSSQGLHASFEPCAVDVFIITVPTPLKYDSIPNVDHVLAATRAIAPHVRSGALVILESTCPVGTTEQIASQLRGCGVDVDSIHIAYCPERILPGAILVELVQNNRIIGGLTPAAGERARDFYATFVKGELLLTDARTAEMTKLVENAYRNVNIAFANELSMICDEAGINVWDVISLANKHPRVQVHTPGTGVGGHCIAVDPLFISHQAKDEAKLIQAAHHRNTEKTKWVIEKIRRSAYDFTAAYHRAPTIACFGISYKPNSDDVRESPSLVVVRALVREQYRVLVIDPHIATTRYEGEKTSAHLACEQADIAVFLVAHDAFRLLTFKENAIILDFCGIAHQ